MTTNPPLVAAPPVVQIDALRKRYGERWVLDGVSFDVQRGEIFGFLGPNGAGKTTTLEILEGLRRPTSGSVRLFGMEVHSHLREIRERIGVSLQSTDYWGLLTVRETLQLFRGMYKRSLPLDELVELFDLGACLKRPMLELSGGNYQRVVLALALVNDPELVFLDEPTTGLDPSARRMLWDVVRSLRSRGRTVILTTHYMEEAEALCGRVAIINQGRIVECGTPDELVSGLAADVAISFSADAPIALDGLQQGGWCKDVREIEHGKYLAYCGDLGAGLAGLIAWATATRTVLSRIETRGPTLDDVFLRSALAHRAVAA